jgi:hypothetical protein
VSDELWHLQGILKTLFVLALLYPGVDLELARWLVKSAIYLDGAEVLGIVIKPGSFLICEFNGIEAAYPIILRPAAAAHLDRHSVLISMVDGI